MHPAVQEARAKCIACPGRVDKLLDRRRFLHVLFSRTHDDRPFFGAGHDEQVVMVANGFQGVVEVVGTHQRIDLVFVRDDDVNTIADRFHERFPVAFDAK